MNLDARIRADQAMLLRSSVVIERAATVYRPDTGLVERVTPSTWELRSSSIFGHRTYYRTDSSAMVTEASVYVGLPAAGLPVTPEVGLTCIAEGDRWLVIAIRQRRVNGQLIGWRLDMQKGGG